MEKEAMRRLLKRTDRMQRDFIEEYKTSMRYYFNENDITSPVGGKSKARFDGKDGDLLRSADNRVSSAYHQILVDQEAGYLATTPPQIDVEDEAYNDKINEVLGDEFANTLNSLVVDAANAGVAWIHYWKDKVGKFQYAIIPPDQVTPIYSSSLKQELLAVRRSYTDVDPDTGGSFYVHEYWTDTTVTVFKAKRKDYRDLEPMKERFVDYDATAGTVVGQSETMKHDSGRIPFIPFYKNKFAQPDLVRYKGQIDVYDAVYNGFVNDVDDIQQVILVLTNYGGESLEEFKRSLKHDQAIKLDSIGPGDSSGVDKLTIDIPVEARKTLLDITETQIFKFGHGVDTDKFEITNATGVAIQMLYSRLELKASNTESGFRLGISELVKAILRYLGMADADSCQVEQTWTRTLVKNNAEKAQILAQVAQYSSDEAIAKANPIVEDYQQELEDRQDDIVKGDGYGNPEAEKELSGEGNDET